MPVTKVGDRGEVQTLEDLVDLTLHEINGLVGLINLSQPNLRHPEMFEPKTSESESSNSEEESMVGKNIEDNPNANQKPWLLHDALAIPGRQHHLPKHPEKRFPRFNPDSKESVEYHIQKFLRV